MSRIKKLKIIKLIDLYLYLFNIFQVSIEAKQKLVYKNSEMNKF